MKLSWLGHSCFSLESEGYTVLLDPYRDVPGLPDIKTEANSVYCSHSHFDHAYTKGVKILPDSRDIFTVREFKSYHDDKKGTLRGENLIRRFEAEGISVVHMGDLGHELDENLHAQLKNTDVLLIPIGGTYTISAEKAKAIADRISPRLIIPMHYRQGKKGFEELSTPDEFTSLYPADFIEISDKSSVELTKNMSPRLLILKMP